MKSTFNIIFKDNTPSRPQQCKFCGKWFNKPMEHHQHETCCDKDPAKAKCKKCLNAYFGREGEIGCQCHVYDTLVCRFYEKGKPSTQKTTAIYTSDKAMLLTRMW